ncbi:MAG: hypothetical protein EPO46_03585 [Lysobacter sp.]|nr:MAG: hypothetical protein EPO46_03585 [Lysobacter sp.]
MPRYRHLATAMLLALVPLVHAQDKTPAKKLYCWNENGRKICGDALPAAAVDSARTEISATSGIATAQLGRALTTEERAAAAAQAEAARRAAEVAEAEHRRFMAMVTTFASEADLRTAFGNRISLSRDSIKTAQMGIAGLRESLVGMLRRAGESELNGRPVPKKIADDIQQQHAQLLKQQFLLVQLNGDAVKIGQQLDEAVTRYRELKGAAPSTDAPTAPTAPTAG